MSASEQLPVMEVRQSLVRHIKDFQCVIVGGETASGKTTQIPQFILDEDINRGKMIAVTQPRRVAAITLAKRVAEERGEDIGGTVGYSVRFDAKFSNEKTKIKYLTDGVLVREGMSDKNFSQYSVVVIDEVHERTLNIDMLLSMLKSALLTRNSAERKDKNPLKLIVMSATIDVDRLHDYLGQSRSCAVFVPGRQFNVKSLCVVNKGDDYLTGTVAQVVKLHKELPLDQHILAFLPGSEDIEYVVSVLKSIKLADCVILPLYSALSYGKQMKAISKSEKNTRHVIISTNIAETSITIPGVTVVLDSGYVKRKINLSAVGFESLELMRISKAESYQRSGRAGRERDGTCYRLYSNEEFRQFDTFPDPEIRRSSVAGLVLQLLRIGMDRPSQYDLLDNPNPAAVTAAKLELAELDAIKDINEPLQLTGWGKNMASTPLDPKYAKLLLTSPRAKLLEPVASLLGVISSENIFMRDANEKTSAARTRFASPFGDLFTYLNIMKEFRKSKAKIEFCKTYKFNYRALTFAAKVRLQLIKFVMTIFSDIELNHRLPQEELSTTLRQLFLSTLPMNVARLDKDVYRTHRGDNSSIEVKIHPTSVLAGKRHRTLHYVDLVQLAGREKYITHVTLLDQQLSVIQ